MSVAPARAAFLPLLAWPEASEAARLELERLALHARIKALPAHGHRRVILQHRLAMLTARALELETRMRGSA